MTTRERLSKLSQKYSLNIIGEFDYYLLIKDNNYIYKCRKDNLSKFKINSWALLDSSYLEYLNNEVFINTVLKAVSINIDNIYILNIDTLVGCSIYKYNINIETILSITSKNNKYLDKIIKILGENYDYSQCLPKGVRSKVIIGCPIHGDFKISVNNILYHKSGCQKCAAECKGYSNHIFNKQCLLNNGLGTLYILKFSSREEVFIKVGITSNVNINDRIKHFPKNYTVEIIKEYQFLSNDIYKIEKKIHKINSLNKFFPKEPFNGRTECYSISILEKIINFIGDNLKNV